MIVANLMLARRDLLVAGPRDSLGKAIQMMLWSGGHHLPVEADGRLVGVLSMGDVLRHRALRGGSLADHAQVEAAMSSPPVTVGAEEFVSAAMARMLGRGLGCLPVVDGGGGLVGLLTRTDLLRHQIEVELTPAPAPAPVESVMMATPAAVHPDATLLDAAMLMSTRGVRHLPVVDDQQRVVGMLSDRDLRNAVGDPAAFLDDQVARDRARGRPVEQVMTRPVTTVRTRSPVPAAVEVLLRDRVGAVPVVDKQGVLRGIVSYLDVLKTLP
jgi:CBS domain-containing protein